MSQLFDKKQPKYFQAIMRGADPIPLTPVQAKKLEADMLEGNNSKSYSLPDLNTVFRVGDVRRVEPDTQRESAERDFERKQWEARRAEKAQRPKTKLDMCRGQYSIQLEIMRIAKDVSSKKSSDNPDAKTWPMLLKDKQWKEQVSRELRQGTGDWCDYKSGDCACDFAKEGPGLAAVNAIFGSSHV